MDPNTTLVEDINESTLIDPEQAIDTAQTLGEDDKSLWDQCWRGINSAIDPESNEDDSISTDNYGETTNRLFEESLALYLRSDRDPCISLLLTDSVQLFATYNVVVYCNVRGGKDAPISSYENIIPMGSTRDAPSQLRFTCT